MSAAGAPPRPGTAGAADPRPADAVDQEQRKVIEARVQALEIEHRDLDDVVGRLGNDVHVDQLRLTRLKKRKLMLKDEIERLKSMLIPDLNA